MAAGVLAANGIHVYVYPRIEPVPTLSFAVRHLGTSAGIVLTASHNPAPYNGYKVYNDNGGQITDEAAAEISANIAKVDPFAVDIMDFEEGIEKGLIEWTPEEVLDSFIENIKKVSVPGFKASDDYSVVYTPLNGTGMELVTRILKEIGVENVTVVPEQAEPDGNFPTCTYPNPEFREALELALKLAEEVKPQPGCGHRPRCRPHGHRHPARRRLRAALRQRDGRPAHGLARHYGARPRRGRGPQGCRLHDRLLLDAGRTRARLGL